MTPERKTVLIAGASGVVGNAGTDQPPPPAFVSAVKLRQAGFTELMDTEEMWRHWLGDLMQRRVIPRARST